jgi:ribose transport system ATP-binding protein
MIEHIVGKRSKGLSDVERGSAVKGDVLLELAGVSGVHKPQDVSFALHRGEVLGLAGLLGSGRSSLARVIAGIEPATKGAIRINGKAMTIRKPSDAIGAGVALVPEARATQGIIPAHSVASNMVLSVIDRLSKFGFVDGKAANDLTDAQIKRLAVKTASRDHAVSTLSGGNQQKVVIGKWLATDPDILILDEPTAGIDIGSKSEIIRLVRELAASGKAIIMISSELSELLTACDRILVMAEGRVHADLPREAFDDPSVPAEDLAHRLQAAEQRLQIEIQRALKAQETTNG